MVDASDAAIPCVIFHPVPQTADQVRVHHLNQLLNAAQVQKILSELPVVAQRAIALAAGLPVPRFDQPSDCAVSLVQSALNADTGNLDAEQPLTKLCRIVHDVVEGV